MQTQNALLGTGDVARLLGIDRWKLIYYIERGILSEPAYSIAGRRLFSEADVDAAKKTLASRQEQKEVSVQQ